MGDTSAPWSNSSHQGRTARLGQIRLRGKNVRVSCPCKVQGPPHHRHSSHVGAGEELAVPGLQFLTPVSLWLRDTG